MTQKIRTIRLYGKLGTKFGREFRLAVSSPAEAIQALCQMIPGFQRELVQSKDQGVGYAVFIGKRNLAEDELNTLPGSQDIRIAPMLTGSKRGGIFQIILGAVLVVVGIWASQAFPMLGQALIGAGVSMVIGGVVQLLTPQPKGLTNDRDDDPSYTFSGSVNTQAQGHPVPLLYGRMRTGSAVISAGISTDTTGIGSKSPGAGDGAGGSDSVHDGGYWRNFDLIPD
jgi:predicted phage tail protein